MPRNFVLHIARSTSSQLHGRLYDSDREIGDVVGCSSVDEVVEAVHKTYGIEVDYVIDTRIGEGLSRLFRHGVFPERSDESELLSSYCILPPGFVPPGPNQLWRKVDVATDLLDVHPIFRRLGWYFLRTHEPDNYAVRFACLPSHNDRVACLINKLLKPGFPKPADLPSNCYYLPDLPGELLIPQFDLDEKLAVVDSMMQVPFNFETQFSYTVRKAIEAAIAKGLWTFWDET